MSVPEQILRFFNPRPSGPVTDRRLTASAEGQPPSAAVLDTDARAQPDLETDLLPAIRLEQFVLHYQPQIDLRSGDVLSIESLLRWNRPGVGLVMPNEFMPLAEQRDLARAITDWEIGAAAEQAAAWDRAGLPPFGIAINVPAAQLHGEGFIDRLTQQLRRKQFAANRIELELTEGAIMRDDAAIDVLDRLRALGVALSIDDFGSGYSSLSDLCRLPIDEIKIAPTFVATMGRDERAAGMVRGIIELAHSLKLHVIADGVETSDQLKRLMDLRCDRAQGALISRPLPAAQLPRFLDEWPRRWATVNG